MPNSHAARPDMKIADMVHSRQRTEILQEKAFQQGLQSELPHFKYRRDEILAAIAESKQKVFEYEQFDARSELAGVSFQQMQDGRQQGRLPSFLAEFEPDIQAQWEADRAQSTTLERDEMKQTEPTAAEIYGRPDVAQDEKQDRTIELER